MTFNPEDFVFKKVDVPEDNPTILEYDALAKYIIVRTTDSYSEHSHEACQLSEALNKNLLEGLPDKYSNRNDRIILFYIREDGKYQLKKEKLKYDFKTKESKWVRYEYKNLKLEEAKEIFEAIKTAVWVQDTLNEEQLTQATIELAKKDVYITRDHAEKMRSQSKLLRDSDWRILEDAPQTFDGERDLWLKYRDKLRKLVRAPESFETEMDYLFYREQFKWPINPHQYDNIDPEHLTEYLSDDKHWVGTVNITELTHEKLKKVNNELNKRIAQIRERKDGGIDIDTKMYRLIERYKLLDNDLSHIKIVEAEE